MTHAPGQRTQEDVGDPTWSAAEERYAYVRHLLARITPPPADLIELGAAPGAQCIALTRVGYRVTAVDLGEAPEAWGDEPNGSMKKVAVRLACPSSAVMSGTPSSSG